MEDLRRSPLTKKEILIKRRKYTLDQVVPAMESAGLEDLADRLSHCGDYIYVATCQNCGGHNFAGNHSRCNSKFCASCASARANAWRIKLVPVVLDYKKKGGYVSFLNLTIKDTQDLSEGLRVLKEAFRYMTHDSKAYRDTWRRLFDGTVRSLEVKIGKGSAQWHPHLHMICLHKEFSRMFDVIKDMWDSCVQKVGGVPSDGNGKHGSVYISGLRKDKTIIENVSEVTKYFLKAPWQHLSLDEIRELVECTKSMRGVQTTGCLYGIAKAAEKEYATLDDRLLEAKACAFCGSGDLDLGLYPGQYLYNDNLRTLIYEDSEEANRLRLDKDIYYQILNKNKEQAIYESWVDSFDDRKAVPVQVEMDLPGSTHYQREVTSDER